MTTVAVVGALSSLPFFFILICYLFFNYLSMTETTLLASILTNIFLPCCLFWIFIIITIIIIMKGCWINAEHGVGSHRGLIIIITRKNKHSELK